MPWQATKKLKVKKLERIVRGSRVFFSVTIFCSFYGAAVGRVTDDGSNQVEVGTVYEAEDPYKTVELPTGKLGFVIGAALGAEAFRRVK